MEERDPIRCEYCGQEDCWYSTGEYEYCEKCGTQSVDGSVVIDGEAVGVKIENGKNVYYRIYLDDLTDRD